MKQKLPAAHTTAFLQVCDLTFLLREVYLILNGRQLVILFQILVVWEIEASGPETSFYECLQISAFLSIPFRPAATRTTPAANQADPFLTAERACTLGTLGVS